ncbi:sensor histidine kinase [Plantibacter sp. Mn2098]|uniref:sensor histidine kinase n=1 Tax=Plantibacter sp. Mn2098 TaxID=3395266 RepID=UPI003BDD0C09
MRGPRLTARFGIRARIAGGSLLIAALIAIAAGVVFNAQIERIVRDGTTAVLRSDSAPYVVALHTEPDDPFDQPGPAQLIAVRAPDGAIPLNTLPAALAEAVSKIRPDTAAHEIRAGSSSYTVLTTTVALSGADWTIIAARDSAEEDTVLNQMRALVFVGLAVIVIGVAAAAWMLTSASLRPVRRLQDGARELIAAPSAELLPVGEASDEVSDLARTLNDLIEKLRDAALRERQLVADASHELRTPIALLDTQLQVAIAEASSIDDLVRDIEGARRNVARLSRLVASLLELSMLELSMLETAEPTGRSSFLDLDQEVEAAVDRALSRTAPIDPRTVGGDGITVSYTRPSVGSDGAFAIRAEDVGRLLDNLLGNSLKAIGRGSSRGGSIIVELAEESGGASVTVTDTGGGLDPAFAPRAFDRFSRQDDSRTAGSGVGLGLAIVAVIVANAGGTIALRNDPGSGLAVNVFLPNAPDTPRSNEAPRDR